MGTGALLVAVVVGVVAGTQPETEAAAPAQTVSVPLFTPVASTGVQSFVRIINHSGDAGTVSIEAIDDDGASYGPLDLAIGAGEAVHLNAGDLEDGDTGKGLSRSTGQVWVPGASPSQAPSILRSCRTCGHRMVS